MPGDDAQDQAEGDAAAIADSLETRIDTRLEAMSAQVAHLTRLVEEMHRLAGPFGVPMPGGRMLVQSTHHIKYLIDPRDLVMAPQLIVYRQWEPELTALFHGLLTADSVFVDVGANFGYFTCLAGSRIGPTGAGRVFAVEPNPVLVDLLRANAAINWSMCPIAIVAAAAGPAAGRAILSVPADGAANASLSAGPTLGDVSPVEVDLQPLDAIVPAGLAVDLMKIDVEGHEMGVLLGARRLLAESPNIKVVLEWSRGQMAAAGYRGEDLLALITELGLSTFEAPMDGRPIGWAALSPERLLALDYGNIVLMRA